jgi:hypothetical protein
MEKVYRNTAVFIFIIILGIQWGFYQTYTSQFPKFKNATNLIHIHGALLMAWMVLLVVQPLLIAYGKANIHRAIGKISYVLGPMIIIMLFLIGRGGYLRSVGNFPEQENLATMVLDIRGFLSFALFWALAMIYRKDSASHMRYMIATGILAIGPGVGRGLISSFGIVFWNALTITDLIDLAIVGALLGFDIYKKKNYKPFLVVFLVLLVGAFLWQVRDSGPWQAFAAKYAALFY